MFGYVMALGRPRPGENTHQPLLPIDVSNTAITKTTFWALYTHSGQRVLPKKVPRLKNYWRGGQLRV